MKFQTCFNCSEGKVRIATGCSPCLRLYLELVHALCWYIRHVSRVRYKLRAAVDIADVSNEHNVWVTFGSGPKQQGEQPIPCTAVLCQGTSPHSCLCTHTLLWLFRNFLKTSRRQVAARSAARRPGASCDRIWRTSEPRIGTRYLQPPVSTLENRTWHCRGSRGDTCRLA